MAKTAHYYTQFEPDQYYHIYNRTIDKQAMFKSEANYEFFLKKYDEYLSPVTDLFAYCLLGNHFHCLIRVRSVDHLSGFSINPNLKESAGYSNLGNGDLTSKSPHEIISHQFRKFFQSYSMAFNKQQGRVGTLFQTPFKRVLIDSDTYFTQMVYYIHANPQHHGLTNDFRDWKWSSYKRILLDKPTKLKKSEVINWFGDKAAYEKYHSDHHELLSDDL